MEGYPLLHIHSSPVRANPFRLRFCKHLFAEGNCIYALCEKEKRIVQIYIYIYYMKKKIYLQNIMWKLHVFIEGNCRKESKAKGARVDSARCHSSAREPPRSTTNGLRCGAARQSRCRIEEGETTRATEARSIRGGPCHRAWCLPACAHLTGYAEESHMDSFHAKEAPEVLRPQP